MCKCIHLCSMCTEHASVVRSHPEQESILRKRVDIGTQTINTPLSPLLVWVEGSCHRVSSQCSAVRVAVSTPTMYM